MSDNLELTAAITTDEPEVAATLDELRFLVFKGKQGDSAYDVAVQLGFEGTEEEWLASLKGEQGEPGKAKSAYLDYDVVRLIEDDSIYTSATMWSDIDNGVVPLIYYISAENVHVYFELDYGDFTGATPIIYFRSKTHLLSVDSTGHFTLTDRPQGGGSATDAVLYTPQSLTPAQKSQALSNIGIEFMTAAEVDAIWESVVVGENVTWNQCPEAVRDYIAEVDYTNVPYTESEISDYAPTPAVISNTKPIGVTVGGVTHYNEIPGRKTPYSDGGEVGTLEPLDQVRWIKSVTNNMRDLGGWACDGGTVKYGLLYRSGELNAQDEDLIVNQLGIAVECDLTADGTPAYPDKMEFIGHTSYAMYSLANTEAWRTNLRGIFDTVTDGKPVVFHCSMGADRTGTLACVLEGLLGVSQSDIDKDYELTSFYALRARNGNYQGGTTDWAHLIGQIEALNGDTFRDKCVAFALSLGFTVSEINAYRHAMIIGNPQDIVVPAVNLFDKDDTDVVLRGRFNSSGAAVAYADGQLVTGYISAAVGDTFVIETDKSLKTNSYTGMVGCFGSAKAYIATIPQGASAVWTFSDNDTNGVCTIPSGWSGHDFTGTAFVRFCISYTDIDNIKIYKQGGGA